MAEKKKAMPALGETVTCPYCGKKGQVLRVFDSFFDVSHEVGTRMMRSGGSGKMIEVNAFLDGCSKDGKIGSNHHGIALEEEF